MRTKDILDNFLKPQVRDIAGRLGFVVPPGTPKPEMVTFVARSLGARCGWSGAIDELLGVLRREELVDLLDGEWSSADGPVFAPTPKLGRLRADDLRDLARDVALAEDEDPTTRLADVFASPRWAGVFVPWDDDEDLDDGSADSGAPSSVGAAWQYETIIEVAAGGPMPDGLEDATPRTPLHHQVQALDRLQDWQRRGGPAGVLCMPTGSGKTQTATQFIVQHALIPTQTTLWLTQRDELVDQAIRTLLRTAHASGRSLRVGRYQGGNRKAREPVDVLVASIPTLVRAGALESVFREQRDIRLAVVDECHHAAAPSWKRLLQQLRARGKVRLLGLSATPTRSAERERDTLWRIFDGTIIHEAHAAELIARGVLAKPDLEFVATNREYGATPKENADWNRFHRGDLPPSLIKRIANDPERNGLIAHHALVHSRSGPTLVFASEKESARAIVEMIERQGGDAAVITYEDPPAERKAVLKAFRDGSLPVLVNLTIFSEGTDLPNVHSVLIGRPTTSPILFSQMVGRGLRGPAIGGTQRCRVVVFHETVLNLASHALTTSFADPRSALAALGCEELLLPEEAADEPPARSQREPVELARMPTRDPEGLRAKMEALLSVLAGKGPPPSSAWSSVPVPLCGWWFVEVEGRRWYLPVFGPDQVVVDHLMRGLAMHVAGYCERPAEPLLLCLPEGTVERFIDRAVTEQATPTFVALESADGAAQASFAHAILGGNEGEPLPVVGAEPILPESPVVEASDGSGGRGQSTPPDTEKVDILIAPEQEGRVMTAPMPVAAPVAAAGQESTRGATLRVGPHVPAEVQSGEGTALVAPDGRRATVLSAARPSVDELRGVLQTVLTVPREHRREWLAQVHERRFRERYPDLVDFALDVMAQGAGAPTPGQGPPV